MRHRRYERGGVVWPLLLVAIGAILLLNNLGITDISLWSLVIQLWPAMLLAIGVDILIPRRDAWGSLLAVAAVAAVLVGSFWLMTRFSGAAVDGVPIAQTDDGVRSAEIMLSPAVGSLRVDGRASPGRLVEGTAAQIGREQLVPDYSLNGGEATFRLAHSMEGGVGVVFPWSRVVWDFSLAGDVPLQLRTDMGVGEADLDLSALEVSQAAISFGVGRTELDLPEGGNLRARIDGGVGEILLRVPRGARIQIERPEGLVFANLPPGYIERGNTAFSPQAVEGDPELVITVDLGVGILRVVETGP